MKAGGHSLAELLVCVALLGLLTIVITPALYGLYQRAQVQAALSELRAAIAVARLHAMQRAQRVDIVPLTANDWRDGWVVLIDDNNNQRLDPGERIVRGPSRLPGGLEISTSLTDARRAYLAFGAGGRPRTASSASQPQFGAFIFRCGSERRKLIMGFLGRVRSCDPDKEGAAC